MLATALSSGSLSVAALIAAVLLALVIPLQLAAAAGAPVAGMLYGGRAGEAGQPLPLAWRPLSLGAALVLPAMAVILLVAGGWLTVAGDEAAVRKGCGVVAVFLGLNTVGNLAGKHWVENRAMATITAFGAVTAALLALS